MAADLSRGATTGGANATDLETPAAHIAYLEHLAHRLGVGDGSKVELGRAQLDLARSLGDDCAAQDHCHGQDQQAHQSQRDSCSMPVHGVAASVENPNWLQIRPMCAWTSASDSLALSLVIAFLLASVHIP
jgi:hypothetical protein